MYVKIITGGSIICRDITNSSGCSGKKLLKIKYLSNLQDYSNILPGFKLMKRPSETIVIVVQEL